MLDLDPMDLLLLLLLSLPMLDELLVRDRDSELARRDMDVSPRERPIEAEELLRDRLTGFDTVTTLPSRMTTL